MTSNARAHPHVALRTLSPQSDPGRTATRDPKGSRPTCADWAHLTTDPLTLPPSWWQIIQPGDDRYRDRPPSQRQGMTHRSLIECEIPGRWKGGCSRPLPFRNNKGACVPCLANFGGMPRRMCEGTRRAPHQKKHVNQHTKNRREPNKRE